MCCVLPSSQTRTRRRWLGPVDARLVAAHSINSIPFHSTHASSFLPSLYSFLLFFFLPTPLTPPTAPTIRRLPALPASQHVRPRVEPVYRAVECAATCCGDFLAAASNTSDGKDGNNNGTRVDGLRPASRGAGAQGNGRPASRGERGSEGVAGRREEAEKSGEGMYIPEPPPRSLLPTPRLNSEALYLRTHSCSDLSSAGIIAPTAFDLVPPRDPRYLPRF
ncbi:hypothetical protein C8F04DRAFT_148367 [Mycena alexandri]|uniref:Uncharacterized protein n=1 Tax=Mycena alexandri TaxID=1745969 RepID=A0AAD6WU53_9AGAR|nr:hypothetical protein C8F04DRAFT_148367 [Mycena alexandri]